jgi:hypothetical protein
MIPTEPQGTTGAVPGGARCALHNDQPAEFTCTRCGNFACGPCKHPGEGGALFCQACSEHAFGDIPMERIAELGFFTALLRTCVGVLIKPWEFFAQRSRNPSILLPLAFGSLIHVPSTLAYAVVNGITQQSQLEELRSNPVFRDNPMFQADWFLFMMSPGGQLVASMLSVFLYPIYLLVFAGLEWLAMFAVGARGASFGDTLRSLCYLQATTLVMLALAPVSLVLGLISPQIGGLLFFPYMLYWIIWLVIALWKTARTDVWRPVAAQGLLLFTCCCLPCALWMFTIFAVIGANIPR